MSMTRKIGKNTRNLLIAGIALVVLVLALLALNMLDSTEADGEDSSVSESSSEEVELYSYEQDEVSVVEVTNESGSYTVTRQSTEKWAIEDLADYPSDETALSGTALAASAITASMQVEENAADLEKYGLENPQAQVSVSFLDADQTTYAFRVGSETATGSYYYFCFEGENDVYAVSQSKLNSFLNSETAYINVSELVPTLAQDTQSLPSEVSIERADLEAPIVLQEQDITEEQQAFASAHKMTSPVEAILDDTKSSGAIYGIFGLSAEEAVLPGPSDEDLAAYGLDDSACIVRVTFEDEVYVLRIGAQATSDDGGYYGMLDGIDVVYRFAQESLPWLDIEPMDVISRLVLLPYIYDLDYVQVDIEGESYAFSVLGDDEEFSFEYQEAELDPDNFREFYQFLLSGVVEDVVTDENDAQPVATITYVYDDASKEADVVAYYPYNERYYQLGVNGEMRFLAFQDYISALAENLENVINGEEINMYW